MIITPPLLNQPVADRFPALEEHEVLLELVAPTAREVMVAGDFNDWRPATTPMLKTEAGDWGVHLLLRAGEYQYRFVVDGRWIEDPEADRHAANPHGGFNSVLRVPLEDLTALL